jgi:hypothetical protein
MAAFCWGHGELAGPVDADEQTEFAFSGLNLGDVDMEEPYGVALELRPLRLVTLHIRQARYAMPLQAPVLCGSCQVRDRGLQGVKSIV